MRLEIVNRMGESLEGSCTPFPSARDFAYAVSDRVGALYDYGDKRSVEWCERVWNEKFESFFEANVENTCQIFNCEVCGWWCDDSEISEEPNTCKDCNGENNY